MYETLLMIHFLSLGAGLGISLTFFVLGLQAAKMPPEEAGPLMGKVGLAMKNVAIAGVTLLVLSGIGLILTGGEGLAESGGWWFRVKMLFVVAVVAAFTVVQINQARARRGVNPPVSGRRAMLAGRVGLSSAVAATILAVLAFG